MYPVMRSAKNYHGWIFATLLLVMSIYLFTVMAAFLRGEKSMANSLWSGELGDEFERVFAERYFLREFTVRWWANGRYWLLGEGLAGVILGKSGWLYTHEEFRSPADLEQRLFIHVEKVKGIAHALAQNDQHLVVVLVPTKLDLYPEFAPTKPPIISGNLYQRFYDLLQANQVDVVNIRQALMEAKQEQAVFFPTDTHWTPFGANSAASEVARLKPELRGNDRFTTLLLGEAAYEGDLLAFLQFDPQWAPQFFKPQLVPVRQTQRITVAGGHTSQDLFDAPPFSLALVGTSYSQLPLLNFPGALKTALHHDLVTMAYSGKGVYFAMNQYQTSDYSADPQIKTVIWEYPVRTLLRHRVGVMN